MSLEKESFVDKEIHLIQCGADETRARAALVVLQDTSNPHPDTCSLVDKLHEEFHTYFVHAPLPPVNRVVEFALALREVLLSNGIKRAAVFGIGPGATVAQAFATHCPRMVRRLILLDATPRLAPGLACRLVDKIEQFLPLGLPLRRLRDNYDSRPMLHRIHCPTLVLLSESGGLYEQEQADYLRRRIPNSWLTRITTAYQDDRLRFSDELQSALIKFMQVPVKRPQKPLSRKKAGSKSGGHKDRTRV